MTAAKLDLVAERKSEYRATRDPAFVHVSRARYLSYEGSGTPGEGEFQAAIGALYAIAYTVKMARKKAGRDYKVCPLEAVWFGDAGEADPGAFLSKPKGEWRWKLLIRTPNFIDSQEVARTARSLRERGKPPEVEKVRVLDLDEGECVQVLHVGPYEAEPESIARMAEFAEREGRRFAGPHHEVYLSDPRRVPPERLKTLLRIPVATVGTKSKRRGARPPRGPRR